MLLEKLSLPVMFVMLITLTSCSDEVPSPLSDNLANQCLLLSVHKDDKIKEEYSYNDLRQKVKRTYIDDSKNKHLIFYEYDATGQLFREEWLKSDSTLSGYYQYEYNDQGKLLTTHYYNNYPNGEVLFHIDRFTYDANGNLLKQSRAHQLTNYKMYDHRSEFVYDANQNKIKSTYFINGDTPAGYNVLEYDSANFLKKEYIYSAYDEMLEYYTYGYDTVAHYQKKSLYNPDDELAECHEFVFDEEDNLLTETVTFISLPSQTYTTTYHYDCPWNSN